MVFDASVLIDYVSHDPQLLGLVATHIAPVVVPLPVLLEVNDLDEETAGILGLTVHETTDEQMDEAVGRPRTLSFQDYICFATARDLSLTCVTNDSALMAYCAANDVATVRGFRPLVALVQAGRMTPLESFRVVRGVYAKNVYITRSVVVTFAQELRRTRRRP